MTFDLEQHTFPSVTHHSIWHAAVFLAPFLEVIPPTVTGTEADQLRQGERHLYRFITELYADMYAHPDMYFIPVGDYDRFMEGKTRHTLAKKDVQKESWLRNRFQQAIQFYQKLLFEIGLHGKPMDGTMMLTLAPDALSEMIRTHRLTSVRGEQEQRAIALARVGMIVRRSSDTITVSVPDCPSVLIALSMLCKSGKKQHALTNVLRCDFRGLLPSFKPGIEDAMAVLSEDVRPLIAEMDAIMQRLPCKVVVKPLKNTTLYSPWKVRYTFRGKSLYAFQGDTGHLDAFAYFNHVQNVSRMGALVRDASDDLYSWFYERIPARTCACKNNRVVDIGGQTKRICGLMNRLEVSNPDKQDMRNLKRVIALYFENLVNSSDETGKESHP
jgi:hypothetical protein